MVYFEGRVVRDSCCGCGYCCMKARCMLSMRVFGGKSSDRCLALVFKEKRFWCQLALDNMEMKKALYIGAGCSSTLFNTQREAFLAGNGASYLAARFLDD